MSINEAEDRRKFDGDVTDIQPRGKEFFWMFINDPTTFAERLFSFHNLTAANTFSSFEVDGKKFRELIEKKYSPPSSNIIIEETVNPEKKNEIITSNILYLLKKDLYAGCYDIPHLGGKAFILYLPTIDKEELKQLKGFITKSLKKEGDVGQQIYLLCQEGEYLDIREFKLKKTKIDLALHYGPSIATIDKLIKKRLSEKLGKGLVLLYGNPGTGKTTYIRYLTGFIKKKLIYVPPQLANDLSSPQFLPLLAEHPNSVLIIEDAENILQARSGGENASVANLLNLADGLLSDCLNIQIICSFNTDLQNVDKALLRKGRLVASHEFKALDVPYAQKLSDKLKIKTKITKPMTLAEIYNQNQENIKINGRAKIGFGI